MYITVKTCFNPTMGHLSCMFRGFFNLQCSECYLATEFIREQMTWFLYNSHRIIRRDDMVPLLWSHN